MELKVCQSTTCSVSCLTYTNLVYGTEREVGIAMKESGVPRSSFFLSTKADGVDDVEGALEASLEKLQTGYVDL